MYIEHIKQYTYTTEKLTSIIVSLSFRELFYILFSYSANPKHL